MGVEISLRNRSTIWLIIGFLLLGGVLFAVNHYSSSLQIGMRSFSFGSSQYIKSHNQASTALNRFIQTEDSTFYNLYLQHLKIAETLSEGRKLLVSEDADRSEVIQALDLGEGEPYGVVELIRVFRRLSQNERIQEMVELWGEADQRIVQLQSIAGEALGLSESGQLDEAAKAELTGRIYRINDEVNSIDAQFFATLSSAGRWIDQVVDRINLAAIVILVMLLGSYTTIHLRAVRKWNEKLEESEKKFKVVLNNSQDVIYQMDLETGKYVYMSPSVEQMLGYELEMVKEGGAEFVLGRTHPDDKKRMEEQVQGFKDADLEEKLIEESQFRVQKKNGEYIWINNKRTLLRDENGTPVFVIGNVRDISERKKYVEALDMSLKEKEMLLAEIHHRVKNNLSIVSSLIELQKESSEQVGEQDLAEIQDRIKSIALVHEKLYQAETLADVDLADYIEDLIKMIRTSLGSTHKNIQINSKLESIRMNNKKAVPLGLIVNELINNCYKYAFQNREKGKIDVKLNSDGDITELTVQDDGEGLPDNFEEKTLDSLGMTLINAFTMQIDGELDVTSKNGTAFKVRFKHTEE